MQRKLSQRTFPFLVFALLLIGSYMEPARAWDPPTGVANGTGPIINPTNCKKPTSQGGWGGSCDLVWKEGGWLGSSDGCDNILGYHPVGYCESANNWSNVYMCCVKEDPNPKPAFDSYMYSKAVCQSYQGTCDDVADFGFGQTCSKQGKVAIGRCNSTEASWTNVGTWDNACCVAQDSEIVKELCQKDPNNPSCAGGNMPTSSLQYGQYTLLEPLPGSDNSSGNLQTYLETLYKVALVLVTLSAIFMLTWGGFVYMTAAANTALISKAKGIIRDAIVGLLIALIAWLILYIINPNLVNLTLNGLAPVNLSEGGASVLPGRATSSLPAQEAAKKLLASSNVNPYNNNSCTGKAAAGSKDNLEQVAAGKGMTRCSCGGGGNVAADPTLLNSLVDIANAGAKFQINVIAGGCHSAGSSHYAGQAVDIQRTASLDAFFAKYPKTSCQGSKTGYKVSGEVVCLEDAGHYHVSPTGS